MIAPKKKYYNCSKCGFLTDFDVRVEKEITIPSMTPVDVVYCNKCGNQVTETNLFGRKL